MPRTKSSVPRKRGRPPYKPSEEMRQTVEFMAAIGIPQFQIAECAGCAVDKLRKHFRVELDMGYAKMITKVAGALYRQAIDGNVNACKFILASRGGWNERPETVEIAKPLGKKEQAVIDAQSPPQGSRWSGLLQ